MRFELRYAGDVVKLEPQVFDLIALLAREAGNLVTRQEVVQSVWQGRIVSEATIDARVAAARRALGDDGKQQRIIKTVPRRGFRFVGAVSTNASSVHAVATENQGTKATSAGRTFTQPVVAVLPFRELFSSLPEDAVFAEGIAEDITTELSRFHAILVTSRMSSFHFRASGLPAKEIAKKLGADFILSGTVRRAAHRIRVVVELYEAREDRQIWSERFDRLDEDIFKALELDPGEAEAHRIAGAGYRARHEFDRATSHIEKALELNPSDTHIAAKSAEHFAFIGKPQRARTLIEKAMALNPMFPSWYWEIIALAEYVDGKYEEALAAITRAANLTFAGFAYQAGSRVNLDRIHEARTSVRQLVEQYPDVNLAVYQRDGRRFAFSEEAIQTSLVKALAISGLE